MSQTDIGEETTISVKTVSTRSTRSTSNTLSTRSADRKTAFESQIFDPMLRRTWQ